MKKSRVLKGFSFLMISLFITGSLIAQTGRGQRPMRANQDRMEVNHRGAFIENQLGLSEEQKEKMTSLRSEHQKKLRYERSILNEKNAKLRTLMSAPEEDKAAIDNAIDDIAGQKAMLMKMQIANKSEMKSILNDEQIEKFEALGRGKGFRDGFRGNRSHNFREGRRGGMVQRGNR